MDKLQQLAFLVLTLTVSKDNKLNTLWHFTHNATTKSVPNFHLHPHFLTPHVLDISDVHALVFNAV